MGKSRRKALAAKETALVTTKAAIKESFEEDDLLLDEYDDDLKLADITPIRGAMPCQLNEGLIKVVCQHLRRGVPIETVCGYVGIFPVQFYDWKSKGTEYINGAFEPPEKAIFGKFVVAIAKAMAQYRMVLNHRVHSHKIDNKHRFVDLVILSRRDRANYGAKEMAGGNEEEYNPDERFD